jgi:hypothetical protein
MQFMVMRDELAHMLGEVSWAVGRINNERIRRRDVMAHRVTGKTKAA